MNIDREMKDWLLDCFDEEADQEEIEGLGSQQLENAINRYFDGGMKEFINCLGEG